MDTHAITQAAYYVAFNLTRALTAAIQRDSPLYWPFLVSALTIGLAVALLYTRSGSDGTGSFRQALRAPFSRNAWWHPSARADYRLYVANALVLPLLFGAVLFSDTRVVTFVDSILGGASAGPGTGGASITSRVVFTLVFFVAYDLGRFVAHSLLHDVAFLWEFHKVHHSAETLNPMTSFRAHPVDLLVMAWIPAVTTGIATWSFNQFVAAPVSAYSFLGLHVLVFAFNLVGILRHSHVWLHYGPRWGKWFISPAHHQLHHSCEQRHHGGVNRGFELAVWDRLYGTLFVPGRKESFRMGLGDGTDPQWHNVRRMYVQPFVNARRHLRGRRRPEPEAARQDAPNS